MFTVFILEVLPQRFVDIILFLALKYSDKLKQTFFPLNFFTLMFYVYLALPLQFNFNLQISHFDASSPLSAACSPTSYKLYARFEFAVETHCGHSRTRTGSQTLYDSCK